jgi:hypothetical protein
MPDGYNAQRRVSDLRYFARKNNPALARRCTSRRLALSNVTDAE